MKTYDFTVILKGIGNSVEEAWRDACEATSLDYDPVPEIYEIVAEDD